MKFNSRQLENMARILGTLCASSIIGFMVSLTRPDSVTRLEQSGLIVSIAMSLGAMLQILKE
jgi:hypothetical protein